MANKAAKTAVDDESSSAVKARGKQSAPIGSPQAILEALRSLPPISPEEVDELLALIEEGMGPADYSDPLDLDQP